MGNEYEVIWMFIRINRKKLYLFIWIILVMYIFYIVYELSIRNDGCILYTLLSKGLNKFKLHFYFYFSKFYTLNTIFKWEEFHFVLTICGYTYIYPLYS